MNSATFVQGPVMQRCSGAKRKARRWRSREERVETKRKGEGEGMEVEVRLLVSGRPPYEDHSLRCTAEESKAGLQKGIKK